MSQCRNTKYGLTLFELVVSLTIIAVFMGTMLIFIHQTASYGKEVALRVGLKSLRLSLVLYKAIKGKYPEDLREFINTRYRPAGADEVLFGEEFLSTVGRDAEGYPVDVFGNRFYYDSRKGVITVMRRKGSKERGLYQQP